MTLALREIMTQREFFHWAEAQDARYEFDGVQPVAMTGENLGHSLLVGNIIRQLGIRLAGSGCRPLGPDAGVATMGDTVRYPDAAATCSKFDGRDRLVPNPVVVFEVVSPTSGRTDRIVKLHEYGAVPTIRRYAIVESDAWPPPSCPATTREKRSAPPGWPRAARFTSRKSAPRSRSPRSTRGCPSTKRLTLRPAATPHPLSAAEAPPPPPGWWRTTPEASPRPPFAARPATHTAPS